MTIDGNRLGHWHGGDPLTSREAARKNYPRSGSQRRRVFDAVVAAGERGATAAELAIATGMKGAASGSSAAKRLSELKQDGWVAATDRTRPTEQGGEAIVYVPAREAA